jgi:hypothetical protein
MTSTADLRAAAHSELLAEGARKFGEIRFKATGDSMLPSVWPGDLLTVRRQSFPEFRRGQIVLYERGASGRGPVAGENAQLVAHRVVDYSGDSSGPQLITRGDSLARNDAPVHEDQILGRVVSISRNGRPIGLDFTRSRRMAAWVLRRSDFAGRVFLRFTRFNFGC